MAQETAQWAGRDVVLLACTVLFALALRLPVLEWGLPPSIPAVVASDIRCSYAFDEDDILTGVSFMQPTRFDFDPRIYHWGTMHFHLTEILLDGAEALGYFERPWRASYYNMVPGQFERVYSLARGLAMFFGLLGIVGIYLLAFEFDGRSAAFWAGAILAASPVQLLASAQVRVDLTMVALVTLAAWLSLRVLKTGSMRQLFGAAVISGLAMAAKYPSVIVVLPMLLVVLHARRYAIGSLLAVIAGLSLGGLLGEPYGLTRWPEILRQVSNAAGFGQPIPQQFALSVPALFAHHAENLFRFGLGPFAAMLCVPGLVIILRRRSVSAALIVAVFIGSLVTLVVMKWPLLRYELLVMPWLALSAGLALARLAPRWRWPIGCAAVVFPLAASFAQIDYMRAPHPANRALATILQVVPPGTAIARIAAELPPLDRKIYPMGLNPFLDDLTGKPPDWVLTADLPDYEYPASNRELLAKQYDEIAVFRSARIFPWATLGESRAPHDWKYTHPTMALYRRRVR